MVYHGLSTIRTSMGRITIKFGQITMRSQLISSYATLLCLKETCSKFDAAKRTAFVIVFVTGFVEAKEWSNSMAKNSPQSVCCARAQLGWNSWKGRTYSRIY